MTSDKKVRVRFAPSPTGPLHMGGVRTALYNYLFAKHHGGDFILRIEDTDRERFVPGAEAYIIESLKWCGIEPNEGLGFGDGPHTPYRQSERKEKGLYRGYAEKLVADGFAYYAFDTREELEEMRKKLEAAKVASASYNSVTRQNMKNSLTLSEDEVKTRLERGDAYVIRIKIPRNEEIRVNDLIRGWVLVNSAQMDDKVLYKSDGMPTYNLANVVDDYNMKITHVIRGEEWLPSAPLHVLLYRYLGWEEAMPQFAHLPLLLRPDGNGKLSKRDGDRLGFPVFPIDWKPEGGEGASGYREAGYFPEAFINMLALLGWHPSGNQEIFTMAELIEQFSLERVSKSGAKFDPEKAKWFNQHYLRHKPAQEILSLWKPELEQKGLSLPDASLLKICGLLTEKASFIGEFTELGSYFFKAPEGYDEGVIKKRWNENAKEFAALILEKYRSAKSFDAATAENLFKESCSEAGIKPGEVMQLFRVVLTGLPGGPALFEVAEILGNDVCVERIELFLSKNA